MGLFFCIVDFVAISIPQSAKKSTFLRGSLTFFYNFELLKTESPMYSIVTIINGGISLIISKIKKEWY